MKVLGLSILGPVLVWLIADPVLGHGLQTKSGGKTLDIDAAAVVVLALLASLAAWGLLAALERFGVRRARTVWTWVSVGVLAVSFLPLLTGDTDGGSLAALALMHLVVAAVLIPGLRMTEPATAATPSSSAPRAGSDGGGSARAEHGRG
ncbi:DUF6069 family protein [Streptomyces sp. NPDC059063]|uniref:DUF6069 family protein n=1 Tax=Streptomyces sp. NPDC059063 TaxID=3346712 RepID=UPI00369EB318